MDNEEPSNGSIQKSASTSCELGSENRPKWNEMSLEGGFLDEENGGGMEEDGGIAVGLGEGLGGLKRIGRSFAERLAARTGGDSPRLNTARFKTVPPSSLPIARSPCLAIPPGLSPTTLLDSPVLLSNSLVAPSPTTGTFSLPSFLFESNVACDLPSICLDVSKNKGCEDRSSSFVFKPYTKSCSSPNPSPLGGLATFGSNNEQAQSQSQSQSQSQTQPWTSPVSATENQFALSSATECKVISTNTDGPMHVAPFQAIPSEATSTQSTLFEEKQQRQDCIMQVRASEVDQNVLVSLGATDKPSEDGYNWRKYGQKLVKGSEYPRSYYKCTHPNCQMKKKLERSLSGQITEIVYKGVHDHPKPQPNRRSALSAGHVVHGGEDRNEVIGAISKIEDLSSTVQGQTSFQLESTGTPELSSSDDDGEVGGKLLGEDADEDESDSKRRKTENSSVDIITANRTIREPRVVVQTTSEIDILDDGYRWRKYGQKVVKGNPNPRSYYKCTNAGCPVRKHVERASHDPKAVITTYEGKHNHDVPAPRNSNHDSAGTGNAQSSTAMQTNVGASTNNNISRSVLQVSDTFPDFERHPGQTYIFDRVADGSLNSQDRNAGILNLGVESSMGFGKLGFANSHRSMSLGISGSGRPAVFQSYFGQAKDRDMNLLSPKEEMPETFNFGASVPVNHSSNSSIYHQSMGRLLMGP